MKQLIRKFVSELLAEEIGRNYHTLDPTPNTWDSFQDFEIEYYPQNDGAYLMDIFFKGKQIIPTSRYPSQTEAQHYARMIIDKYRVEYMNKKDRTVV